MEENDKLVQFLVASCHEKSVLCINEGSLLGLYLAKLGEGHVTIVEPDPHFRQILHAYAEANSLARQSLTIVENVSELEDLEKV